MIRTSKSLIIVSVEALQVTAYQLVTESYKNLVQSLWLKKRKMGQDHNNKIMVVLFLTPHNQLMRKQKPQKAKQYWKSNSEGIDKD